MDEKFVNKIRKDLNVPKEYVTFKVNSEIWERFEDEKECKGFLTHSSIDPLLSIYGTDGYYTGKTFIIHHSWSKKAWSGNTYTLLFTKDIKEFYNKYFKLTPVVNKIHKLKPGTYKPEQTMFGYKLTRLNISTNEAMPILNDDMSAQLEKEIDMFLAKKDVYEKMNMEYKRGILLYGPPGNGKTTFIKNFIKDVEAISILINPGDPGHIAYMQEVLTSKVNDDLLKIIIMEDIDGVRSGMRSTILNFLDGLTRLHKVLFVATTNHVKELDTAFTKRPSRFDSMIRIGEPNEHSRRLLLERYFSELSKEDMDTCIINSKGLSGAFFKELFILSEINDYPAEKAISVIKSRLKEIDDEVNYMG